MGEMGAKGPVTKSEVADFGEYFHRGRRREEEGGEKSVVVGSDGMLW